MLFRRFCFYLYCKRLNSIAELAVSMAHDNVARKRLRDIALRGRDQTALVPTEQERCPLYWLAEWIRVFERSIRVIYDVYVAAEKPLNIVLSENILSLPYRRKISSR